MENQLEFKKGGIAMINNPVVSSTGGGDGDNHQFRPFYNRMGQ